MASAVHAMEKKQKKKTRRLTDTGVTNIIISSR